MVSVIVVIVRKKYRINKMNRDEPESVSSSWQNTCYSENTKRVNALLNEYSTQIEGLKKQAQGPTKKSVIKRIHSMASAYTKVNCCI